MGEKITILKITPPGEQTREITFPAFKLLVIEGGYKGQWISEKDDISIWRTHDGNGGTKVEGLKASGEDLSEFSL
jgi:hypothetical protein